MSNDKLSEPEQIFNLIDMQTRLIQKKKIDLTFNKLDPDARGRVNMVGLAFKLRTKFDPFTSELLRQLLTDFSKASNTKRIDRETFHALITSKYTKQAYKIDYIINDIELQEIQTKVEHFQDDYRKHYLVQKTEKEQQLLTKEQQYQQYFIMFKRQFSMNVNFSQALHQYKETNDFTQSLYNKVRYQEFDKNKLLSNRSNRSLSNNMLKTKLKQIQYMELKESLKPKTPIRNQSFTPDFSKKIGSIQKFNNI